MARIRTVQDPAVAVAEGLWAQLRSNFLDTENTIKAIIQTRAWEPLGYESFAKAWIDKMSDLTLPTEIIPHVVFEMFSEGLTADEIANAVKGIGRQTAEYLERQRDNGVPAEAAETVVRRHHRRKPARHWIEFEIQGDELRLWKRLASQQNMTVRQIALRATRDAFKALEDG